MPAPHFSGAYRSAVYQHPIGMLKGQQLRRNGKAMQRLEPIASFPDDSDLVKVTVEVIYGNVLSHDEQALRDGTRFVTRTVYEDD